MPPSAKESSSAKALAASLSSSSFSLYLVVALGLFLLFGLYYWYFILPKSARAQQPQLRPAHSIGPQRRERAGGVPDTTHREAAAEATARVASVPPEKALTTMYVPKEVGHRSGMQRVFLTNKGLRVYETNEHGWPMPTISSAPSAGPVPPQVGLGARAS